MVKPYRFNTPAMATMFPLRCGGETFRRTHKASHSSVKIPDAPSGVFVHWLIFNLPPIVSDLPEALPTTGPLEVSGASQGQNDFKNIGYDGPCPPPGNFHRYVFRLYALDIELPLQEGATKHELARAMEGHILATGQLMGTYKRRVSQAAG